MAPTWGLAPPRIIENLGTPDACRTSGPGRFIAMLGPLFHGIWNSELGDWCGGGPDPRLLEAVPSFKTYFSALSP